VQAQVSPSASALLPVLEEVRQGTTAPLDVELAASLDPSLAAGHGTEGVEDGNTGDRGAGGISWDLDGVELLDASDKVEAGVPAGISWDLDGMDLVSGDALGGMDDAGDDGHEVPGAVLGMASGKGAGTEGGEAADAINWAIELDVSSADNQGGAAGIGEDAGVGGTEGRSALSLDAWSPAIQVRATGCCLSWVAPRCPCSATASTLKAADVSTARPLLLPVQRLILDVDYRTCLLDNLYELRAFLIQRCSELAGVDEM
jgi:hypothetical protein